MSTLRYNGKFINLSIVGSSSPGPGPSPSFYNESPTLVEYADTTSASLDIVGEASRSNLTGWANVTRVLFGNTVTSIAANLFRNSTSLKYAYTGWNCSRIGTRSFNDCSIQDVVFGPGIEVIGQGQYAFSGSSRLSSMTFHPDSQLSAVGYGAVRTTGLKELSVCSDSSSLTFENWSFSNNQALSVLVLDVQTVPILYRNAADGLGAFNECPHLTSTSYDGSIVVPDALKDSFLNDSRWSDIPSSKFVAMSEWTGAGSQSFITSCFYNSQLIWGSSGEQKPDPLSALYRRWSFDTLSDSVAGVPMTLFGNAHLDNGALVINGNTQQKVNYAQLSGNNWPTSSETGATVEFWITPTALRNWQRSWCAGDGSSVNFFDYAKYGLADTMLAAINVNGTQTLFTPPLLNLNVMQHIAVVYDITPESGTDLTVYQFQPSHDLQTLTGHTDAVMADAWQGSNVWYLGRTMYDGWYDPDFDGSMQEFRVWNRPLTFDEIVACDEAGPDEMPDWTPKPPVPVPLSALYRHWTFDTLSDEVAGVPVQLFGNAHLDNGSLVINGSGQASTQTDYAQLSANNWPTASYDGGVTVEFWTEPYVHRNWVHLLDFGEQTDKYQVGYLKAGVADCMYLEMQGTTYSTSGRVAAPTLNLNTLQHVAIVMDLTRNAPDTAVSVCQFQPDHSMTLNTGVLPINLTSFWQGSDKQFLGRTGNPSWQDADYSGRYADFRIWSTILSKEQLCALDSAGPDALPQ